MRWRGRRQSKNVQDMRGGGNRGGNRGGGGFRLPTGRRSGKGGGFRIPIGRNRGRNQGRNRGRMGGGSRARGGGMGCGTLVIIGIVLWFIGINPLTLLTGAGGGLGSGMGPSVSPTNTQPGYDRSVGTGGRTDEMTQFVSTILASTEDVWSGIFKSYGRTYEPPVLVLFDGQVRSACGFASSASGPFYCPADRKAYIDLSFYRELATRFGAKGDFAQAYVLAHEVGHHIQNVIGVLPQFNRMRQRMGKLEANQMSIKVELQADCFAGVWGHYVNREGWLERGDLEEALVAANQIGDDAIQKRTQGYVVPESFSHGTSEQRRYWFSRGFETGRIESCDTINTPQDEL